MHSSLTILIILTVVVLIVILMTSPTCKNAVGSILKGKKKETSSDALTSTAGPSVEKKVASREEASKLQQRKAAETMETYKKAQSGVVQSPAKVESSQPRVEVKSDPQFKVLSGNILDMFNNTVDVEKQFGLTESQINELAMKYKAEHLDVHREEVTRHRSFVRSDLDEADAKLRDGFQKSTLIGKKPNMDETVIAMREEKLANGEDLTRKKKGPVQMVLATKGRK